jgi:hypothetical protein
MIERCSNPDARQYKWYGGVGVRVCDEWKQFDNFLRDMGPRPGVAYAIDRTDPHGSYEPSNCEWRVKGKGVRTNTIFFQGKTLVEWAKELNVKYATVAARYRKHGTVQKK